MMNYKSLQIVFLVLSCCGVKLVSSCTQDTFDVKAQACVNGFFTKIKEDPEQNCSTLYNETKNCITLVFNGCKNSTDSKALIAIAQRARKAIASESYYCENGMLYSFKGSENLPDCQKKALEKARKCTVSFYEKFSKNKADPSLCRKYSKAKACIKRALGKYCKRTEKTQDILKIFQNPFNPFCHGTVDTQKKPIRSPSSPFGACTAQEYMKLARVCMVSFVQVIQENPEKPCRSVFTEKLHNCAKEMVLYCLKNESDYAKQNMEKYFSRTRPSQQRKFCDGVNFGLSYPSLRKNQCTKNFYLEKYKCEESYVRTYKENKADESLCRKYAEAKRCARNVSLTLCQDTPQLRYEVTFIYDEFKVSRSK